MEYKVQVMDKEMPIITVSITSEVQFAYKEKMLARFDDRFDEESIASMSDRDVLENHMIIYAEIVLEKLEQLEKVSFNLHGDRCELLVEEVTNKPCDHLEADMNEVRYEADKIIYIQNCMECDKTRTVYVELLPSGELEPERKIVPVTEWE